MSFLINVRTSTIVWFWQANSRSYSPFVFPCLLSVFFVTLHKHMEDLVKDKKGKMQSLQNVKSTKKSLHSYVSAVK